MPLKVAEEEPIPEERDDQDHVERDGDPEEDWG